MFTFQTKSVAHAAIVFSFVCFASSFKKKEKDKEIVFLKNRFKVDAESCCTNPEPFTVT